MVGFKMVHLLFNLVHLTILLSISEACHPKNLFTDPGPGEVHHHHYGSNPEGPGPITHQAPEQPIYGPEGPDEPAKHVVVLQPARPQPPLEDDFFDFWPKKLHPKYVLKNHIHKLKSKFRDLFFDHKSKFHGRPIPPPHPPQAYHHQHPGPVAVPALKVPLVQVEAYKTAPYSGGKGHAVAYVSPDGYQPAVVVKQKGRPHPGYQVEVAQAVPPHPQHYASPAPTEAYQPTPQPVNYYNPQPSYQPQQQPVAYQQTYPAQPAYQSQAQPVSQYHQQSYPTLSLSSPGGSNPYGPQGYQPSHPLYEQPQRSQFPSANYFGPSSQTGYGNSNPYSIDSSSFGGSSSFK